MAVNMSCRQYVLGISLEGTRITSQKESKASSSNVADPRSQEYLQPRYYERLLDFLGENDVSVMAKASMNFDKQALISIHEKARLYLTHPQAEQILRMHKPLEHVTESTHQTTEATDELVPVSLRDLKIGNRNEGVVLFGEFCVEPLKIGRIYTLLEEAGTGKAVALCIAFPYQYFARNNFPQGTKIVLKEPMLVQGESDLVFIHVENPLCIQIVQSLPDPKDINFTAGKEKIKKWMAFGHMAYRAGEWENCIRNYSKCVACLSQGMKVDASTVNVMYTERCVAYFELHRYEEAVQDADKVEPSESIEVQFKIRSLLSVGRYKDAFSFLQRSCALFPEKKQIFTTAYRRWSAVCFDIGKAIIGSDAGSSSALKPDGDFIGPVEIRMTSNGCGRGLFATEKIEEGEVLLISKALAISQKCREQNELLQNVKDKLKSCGEKTRQIFFSHCSKDLSCLIPCMSDFITESAGEYIFPTESNEEITTACERYEMLSDNDKDQAILHILNRIALDDSSPSAMQQIFKQPVVFNPVPTRLYYGAWLLPSFINHSCAPNAARINLGDIMRIHAATDISAGEEICIPYFNVLFPYPCRQEACESFGFRCLCERCELEKMVMEHKSKTRKLYREYLIVGISRLENRDTQLQSLAAQVEKCMESLKRMVNEDEDIYFYEGWIRASFTPLYSALLENRWRKNGIAAVIGMVGNKIEQETLYNAATAILATCPGSLQCLIFFHRCLCLWKDRAGKYAEWGLSSFAGLYDGLVSDAQKSLEGAFPSVYGHQNEHVVQAFLKYLEQPN
ncbi:uncharacterized protein LOC131054295 [Cryptomeria japonica]|uniref:uncharacterized protein LOC131054295 n=1 Tax=Cryptomeria japonica TaxID=3369 RepID=UPI0027DA17FB|nr:uncharacterized protein LOC131054295 [Cryptomeria japonica]